MPGYKGHIIGGVLAFSLARYVMAPLHPTLFTSLTWLVCTLIGALLPDIDIKSKGQNAFYVLLAGGYVGALALGHLEWSPYFVGIALFPMLIRHRGLSHSPWFMVALCGALGIGLSILYPTKVDAVWLMSLFVGIGMGSHIVLDKWITG